MSLRAPSRPPSAFTFIGQPFVWSAFIFSKFVFDQVLKDNKKVARRMTSGVNAAFALFGNDAASSVVAERIVPPSTGEIDFVKFRDDLPYTTNLIAARQVVDSHLSEVNPRTASIAMLWQLALRELSQPSANRAKLFDSTVWKKRQMNTQLASFTQLRHDTLLYAKQSVTIQTSCEYPAGYVDPYPSFWLLMHQLARRMLAIVNHR